MNPLPPPFEYAGELAALSAAVLWSISLTIFTHLGKEIPSYTLNLFKNIFAFLVIAIMIVVTRPEWVQDSSIWIELGISGIVGLSIGDTALFTALKRLGAQITAASQCLAPPLAAFIAMIFLDETLSSQEWIGLIITVSSVAAVIILKKNDTSTRDKARSIILTGVAAAILSATCQSIAIVIQRHAMQSIDIFLGTGIRVLPALIVLSLASLKRSSGTGLGIIFKNKKLFFYLCGASFMGTFMGLILQSAGTKYAKAAIAAALTSTYPLWIIPLAAIFLNEKTSKGAIAATFCAVGGIILMTF